MKIVLRTLVALFFCFPGLEGINLEEHAQSFVLENKKITLPNYPHAFNPSIVRWNGLLILSFRVLDTPITCREYFPKSPGISRIGLALLDDELNPISEPHILTFEEEEICRSEDARLLTVGESLYIVYSDNREPVFCEGGFRMFATELDFDGENFFMLNTICLKNFERENPNRREKNWVPFDYYGNLLFAYSIAPHRILLPLFGTDDCQEIATTLGDIEWKWGELRGGTPALLIDPLRYLGFFHSSIDMASEHSGGATMPHYFMGAYTFNRHPPFEITAISPEPIIGKDFYCGEEYPWYWKPVRVVFPCGFLIDGDDLIVVFGRQDHEMWAARLDKKELLKSLIPVKTVFPPFLPL